jgi:hypothetical protein
LFHLFEAEKNGGKKLHIRSTRVQRRFRLYGGLAEASFAIESIKLDRDVLLMISNIFFSSLNRDEIIKATFKVSRCFRVAVVVAVIFVIMNLRK